MKLNNYIGAYLLPSYYRLLLRVIAEENLVHFLSLAHFLNDRNFLILIFFLISFLTLHILLRLNQ